MHTKARFMTSKDKILRIKSEQIVTDLIKKDPSLALHEYCMVWCCKTGYENILKKEEKKLLHEYTYENGKYFTKIRTDDQNLLNMFNKKRSGYITFTDIDANQTVQHSGFLLDEMCYKIGDKSLIKTNINAVTLSPFSKLLCLYGFNIKSMPFYSYGDAKCNVSNKIIVNIINMLSNKCKRISDVVDEYIRIVINENLNNKLPEFMRIKKYDDLEFGFLKKYIYLFNISDELPIPNDQILYSNEKFGDVVEKMDENYRIISFTKKPILNEFSGGYIVIRTYGKNDKYNNKKDDSKKDNIINFNTQVTEDCEHDSTYKYCKKNEYRYYVKEVSQTLHGFIIRYNIDHNKYNIPSDFQMMTANLSKLNPLGNQVLLLNDNVLEDNSVQLEGAITLNFTMVHWDICIGVNQKITVVLCLFYEKKEISDYYIINEASLYIHKKHNNDSGCHYPNYVLLKCRTDFMKEYKDRLTKSLMKYLFDGNILEKSKNGLKIFNIISKYLFI